MHQGVHSCLRVPADLTAVSFVRSALACMLTREEWPADGAGRVLLASTEAVTNAIEHGSPGGAAVEVELTVTAERVDVRVLDEGHPGGALPVVPTEPPPPTAVRGRGLIIISRLSDELDVSARDNGTQVVVGFLRHAAREAPAALPVAGLRAQAA